MKAPIDFLQANPDRYRRLISGEKVDYAPFRLWLDQTFVCDFTRTDPKQYANDLDVMFETQRIVNERFYDLRDYEIGVNFMDLYDEPAKVRRIFAYMTQRNLAWLEFQQKQWVDYNRDNNLFDKIDIGEDYSAYLPPYLFDDFVKPYTGALVEAWKGRAVCSLHTDGDIQPAGIPKLGELGIDELMGFSPNVDIKDYRRDLPDMILGGNIHPIRTMNYGTPQDVKYAARYCFDNGNQNQRFVLCTGGAITAGANPENVDAFLEATYVVVKYE